ncbi:MAG: acyltransferase [Betaproteobacteria bacterium]
MSLAGALSHGWRIDDAALDGRNNFHLVRLFAALLVLFAHSFHLLQRAGDEPLGSWFIWLDASLIGVSIFFFVSGFLVARSWDRRGNLAGFLAARALRIAPALWLVLVVTVLGLGALVTTLPAADYFHSAQTKKYLVLNAILYTQYLLPGVFESNPVPGVNGSLWTIPLEVVLYLILAVCGFIGLLEPGASARSVARRIALRPLLSGALILLGTLLVSKVLRTGAQYYTLAGYFLLGTLCYRYRHRLSLRLDLTLGLAIIAIAAGRTPFGPIVMPLAIASTTLAVALHPAFGMRPTWFHRHDYSYGAYLYGFPVQQALIAAGLSVPLALFGCAVIVTLLCAAVSWHAIERPALHRKPQVEHAIATRFSRRYRRG